jgi:hypothetical protein
VAVPPSSVKGGNNWQAVEITFLSEFRIQIRNGARNETLSYAEFGFSDGRTGNPNQAWAMLLTLAKRRGSIRTEKDAGCKWLIVEKRVQEIRRVLRKQLGFVLDPLPYVDGAGYTAKFKIGCGPSFSA